MTKISPWFLLLAVVVGLFYFTGAGNLEPRPWYESIAFPAYVVVMVVLDHLVLPRTQWRDKQKVIVRSLVHVVMTALLILAMRPSLMVSGLLIILALQSAWTALSDGKR